MFILYLAEIPVLFPFVYGGFFAHLNADIWEALCLLKINASCIPKFDSSDDSGDKF